MTYRKAAYIYGICTKDHVHYIGSTFNLRLRYGVHMRTDKIKWLLSAGGGAMIVLAVCDHRWAYKHERELIEQYWRVGQCELNDNNAPKSDGKRMNNITRGKPVLHTVSGQVYPSISAAIAALNLTQSRMRDLIVEGVITRLPKTQSTQSLSV